MRLVLNKMLIGISESVWIRKKLQWPTLKHYVCNCERKAKNFSYICKFVHGNSSRKPVE
jgi:hypothetical protein